MTLEEIESRLNKLLAVADMGLTGAQQQELLFLNVALVRWIRNNGSSSEQGE